MCVTVLCYVYAVYLMSFICITYFTNKKQECKLGNKLPNLDEGDQGPLCEAGLGEKNICTHRWPGFLAW